MGPWNPHPATVADDRPALEPGGRASRDRDLPDTFSRAMCWAAAHRGSLSAKRLGHRDLAGRWAAIAESQRELVLRRGYNERLGFFAQSLDGGHPDASNLLLPTIGLLDARDPRFVSTLAQYEKRLVPERRLQCASTAVGISTVTVSSGPSGL